jgi:hypothetical protein
MLRKCISTFSFAAALTIGMFAGQAVAQEKAATPAAPQAKPTMAKLCANCHQPQPGTIRGNFDSVAYKTRSIQVKIDEATEILRFDDKLKLENVQALVDSPDQPLQPQERQRGPHRLYRTGRQEVRDPRLGQNAHQSRPGKDGQDRGR